MVEYSRHRYANAQSHAAYAPTGADMQPSHNVGVSVPSKCLQIESI